MVELYAPVVHVHNFFVNTKFVDMQEVHAILEVHVLHPAGQMTHVVPESLYPAGQVVSLF